MSDATPISSRDNPRVKLLHALAGSGRERRKHGLSLLDGEHLVAAAGEAGQALEYLVVAESALARPAVQALLATPAAHPPVVLKDALFAVVSPVDTPTGLLAVFRVPSPLAFRATAAESLLALEGVQDAGNLGTILRTAAAAGIRRVLLSPGCAQAWSPKVLRAGMGAHFHLQLHEQADLLAALEAFPGTVLATALGPGARGLYALDLRGPCAWLFGAEGQGLGAALLARADVRVRIPMLLPVESLNVAAAAAVCLFEQVRQGLAQHLAPASGA